jgi:superoxide dismutase, Cu-Zn family
MRTLFATALVPAVLAGSPGILVASRPTPPPPPTVVTERYGPHPPAITYRPDLVPIGARATVVGLPLAQTTTVVLVVTGLLPNREYGAHVHVRPCGTDPATAGPHYQHQPDAQQPSTNPQYANPTNEIWLDLTTNAQGTALTTTTVNWTFDEHRPRAVVLHETHTHTAPGEAGTAGPRLACLTATF